VKKCIWCSISEPKTEFKKLAHTIPQTLGGKNICQNVCDKCNLYFGSYNHKLPPIETVIKETFNISRARFLQHENEIGKNKAMPKFSSIYFNVDFVKNKLTLKSSYKHNAHFQEKISRQFKKGLYKIFLEETERQRQDGHNTKYDFIREFSRYDLGDFPVFYFQRKHGIVVMTKDWAKTPELFFEDDSKFEYLVNEPCFFEFELLGHVFGIATSRHWEIALGNYLKKTCEAKKDHFKSYKVVEKFNDVDLSLAILNG
jgi:hypothetical protein